MSLISGEEYFSSGMDNINEGQNGLESVIGFHQDSDQSTSAMSDPLAKVHGLGQSDVTIDIPSKFKHCPACNPKSLKVVRGSGKKSVSGSKKAKPKKRAPAKKAKAPKKKNKLLLPNPRVKKRQKGEKKTEKKVTWW